MPPPSDRSASGRARGLGSRAIGSSGNNLIARCPSRPVEAADPPRPPVSPSLALALSGGGFRATLSALGVLRFLADAGLLARVRFAPSVSGGSIANGLFACNYEKLSSQRFSAEALDAILTVPFVNEVSSRSLTSAVLRGLWRAVGKKTRTDVLADLFEDRFLGVRTLESLSHACRFIFNAASVTTGVRFGFEGDVLGDWVMGEASTQGTGLKVAQAAAASAAVPGAFAPFVLKDIEFPCSSGRVQKLLDGGAYDNSGLEAVDDLPDTLLIALNSGGLFHTGAYGGIPIIRDLKRCNALLYRQSTGLRRREMVDRFKVWEEAVAAEQAPPEWGRQGVLFGLATTFKKSQLSTEWASSRPPQTDLVINELAEYKTTFAKIPLEVCKAFLYRGWWLTGATLASFHRNSLPDALPVYRDPF